MEAKKRAFKSSFENILYNIMRILYTLVKAIAVLINERTIPMIQRKLLTFDF